MTPAIVIFLLDDLRTALGVCLKPDDRSRIANDPPSSIEALCDAVIAAAPLDLQHREELRKQVLTRMYYALVDSQ